jgi:hypothetical protein
MNDLISKAIEINNIEILNKLLEMKTETEKMVSKKAFYKALSEFQTQIPSIKKTKTVYNRDGKTVRYNYASFDDVVEAIKPLLNKHGLSYRFEAEYQDKIIIVKCFISHIEGWQEITTFRAIVQYSEYMLPIQALATALTYAKRYSLSLALGLATEEDTDANDLEEEEKEILNNNIKREIERAKEEQAKVKEKMKETDVNGPTIDEKQIKNIQQIIDRKNLKEDEAIQIISRIIGRSIISLDKIKKSEANRVMIELVKVGVE